MQNTERCLIDLRMHLVAHVAKELLLDDRVAQGRVVKRQGTVGASSTGPKAGDDVHEEEKDRCKVVRVERKRELGAGQREVAEEQPVG